MAKIFIKDEHLKTLTDIFKEQCPDAEIWAYGSRVTGDAHEGSDLDLVIRSLGNSKTSACELKELIKEANIPFLIDMLEFDSLPEIFKREITEQYEVIYNGQKR